MSLSSNTAPYFPRPGATGFKMFGLKGAVLDKLYPIRYIGP